MHLLPDSSMLFCGESDRESAKGMKIICMLLIVQYMHLYETYAFYQPRKYSSEDKCIIYFLEFQVLMQYEILNYAIQSLISRQSLLVLHIFFSNISPTFNFHTSSSSN